MIGEKIPGLYTLKGSADSRESVIVPKIKPWDRPRAAAFMVNLSGVVLLQLFESGMYVYKKEEK